MIASHIGKFLYRNRIVGETVYGTANVYFVTQIIGGKGFAGQTIGTFIFILPGYEEALDHEYVHVGQWRSNGSLGFPLRYFGEFIWNYLKLTLSGFKGDKKQRAYLDISFEKEARLQSSEEYS